MGARSTDIARANRLPGEARLFVGQVPVFVLADDINPFTRKIVRRVVVSDKMAAELATQVGRPIKVFPYPERFGFFSTGPEALTSLGRHALGMRPSPYLPASTKLMGAQRFSGKPFWIDVAKAKLAGASVHDTDEITHDVQRIASKTTTAKGKARIGQIIELASQDKEVLIKGDIPATAIKGGTAMAATRVLQGVQIVGFAISAYQLEQAGEKSLNSRSVKPIAAETVRQAGGWAAAQAGMKLDAATGAFFGIETGPGAMATGLAGGVVGGVAGCCGFDWIANHVDAN